MHPIVAQQRQAIAQACQRFGVQRLDVFGSAARDDFDETRSDVDFLVDFGGHDKRSPFDTYFALKDELERIFGRPVDLLSDGALTNPYVLATIARDRQQVYPE